MRLGSNAGIADDAVELDSESFTIAGRLSPMSCLARNSRGTAEQPVSILSFSPPTFRASPFPEAESSSADFVMIMEEDPPLPSSARTPALASQDERYCCSTQPNTPTVSASVASEVGIDDRTTVMLRNIPNKYTQPMLLTEVNSLGFEGQYDFFYLPIDYGNSANVGYAFVNFVHHYMILDFYKEFQGRKWAMFNSKKKCDIKYGRI
jgi:hypothetical protein